MFLARLFLVAPFLLVNLAAATFCRWDEKDERLHNDSGKGSIEIPDPSDSLDLSRIKLPKNEDKALTIIAVILSDKNGAISKQAGIRQSGQITRFLTAPADDKYTSEIKSAMCMFSALVFPLAKKEDFSGVDDRCITIMLAGLFIQSIMNHEDLKDKKLPFPYGSDDDFLKMHVSKLKEMDDDWFNLKTGFWIFLGFFRLNTTNKQVEKRAPISMLGKSVLGRLFGKNPELCGLLTCADLQDISKNSEVAGTVTGPCFANVGDFGNVKGSFSDVGENSNAEFSKLLGEFPKIFSLILTNNTLESCVIASSHVETFDKLLFSDVTVELHENWFIGMTADQAAKFGANVKPASDRCKNMRLERLGEDGYRGLLPECFAGVLANRKIPDSWDDNKSDLVASLKSDIFKEIKPSQYQSDLAKVPSKFWKQLTSQHVAPLLTNVSGCGSIPADAFEGKEGLNVTPECFGKLSAKAQCNVLRHNAKSLKTDQLSHVKSLKGWSVPKSAEDTSETFQNVAVLEVIGELDGYEKIVESLGTKTGGIHPCSEIDLEHLQTAPKFQAVVGHKCISAMKTPIPDDAFGPDGLNPRLYGMRAWPVLEQSGRVKDLDKIGPDQFKQLVEGRVFCENASYAQWERVPKDSLVNMDATCVSLIPKTTMGRVPLAVFNGMPAAAFGLMTGAMAGLVDVAGLTDDRFAQLSSEIADESQTYSVLVKAKAIAEMSPDRVRLLPASFWKPMHPEAFSGLTEAQFKAIPADNMVHWSLEQVERIHLLVRKQISEAQMLKIGLTHDKTLASPIPAFKSFFAEFPADIEKAFHKRNEAPAVVASLVATAMGVAIGVLLAL